MTRSLTISVRLWRMKRSPVCQQTSLFVNRQACLPTRQGNSGISFLVVYTQRDFQGNLQLQAKILPCFSASLDNLDFILERKTSGVFDLSHLDLNSAVSFTSSIKSNNLGSKLICMGNYTRN